MKRLSPLPVPFLLSPLLALCLLLSACDGKKDPDETAKPPSSTTASHHEHGEHTDHGKHTAHTGQADRAGNPASDHQHETVEAAPPTDQSLYQVESDWQTQTGKTIKLASLGGKPLVLAMVYASCKNACPRIIADMKQIQAEGEKNHPGAARFVLVSIDPDVDTPERLAELAHKSHLDDQWLLLRGDSDEVMELAALLGVKYRKISDKDYAHTNLITVLDAKGEIVHRQQGLGVDSSQTVKALSALQNAG